MKNRYYTLLILFMTIPMLCYSQDGSEDPIECHVDKVYPAITLSMDELDNTKTIQDINSFFKSEWVREYISVEYSLISNGKEQRLTAKDGQINNEQLGFIKSADNGVDISVNINYIPENTLRNNEPKEDNFSFIINPKTTASYPGGSSNLERYLQEHVLSHVSKEILPGYSLAAVKFTTDAKGNIQNIQIIESSNDEKTDALLLDAVNNMPNWIPAQYTDGTKVSQDNMLTVGNMKSCTLNLLNIKRRNFEMQ